jgi:hypothetical protein
MRADVLPGDIGNEHLIAVGFAVEESGNAFAFAASRRKKTCRE